MRTFGLIGKSLSHSFSQQYFTEKFLQQNIKDAKYYHFQIANIQEVNEFLKQPAMHGFNITIPYKTEIIPFLDELDDIAQEVGAVNCIVKRNNKWIGYNTDVEGFEIMLQKKIIQKSKNDYGHIPLWPSALVLGSGGAAKAVCYVLKQKNISFQIVSRNKNTETITYNEVSDIVINHSKLIINTTPLGMFPFTDALPKIPYHALNNNNILIDLIYNPEETLFLEKGKKHGALTMNGLKMFEGQADASYKIFNP